MIDFVCPKCHGDLGKKGGFYVCSKCLKEFPERGGLPSFFDKDVYWGEFKEEKLLHLLDIMKSGDTKAVFDYIEDDLKRTDFIFGKARSDFLYYLPLSKDASVLDIGSGLGIHSFNIAPYVREVYGLDQSVSRIRFSDARKKLQGVSNVHFVHGEVSELPFKNESFDMILMNGVVEWLGNINHHKNPKDDQIEVLTKMHKHLKRDGVLYIGIENRFATAYLTGIDHNGLRWTSYFPRFVASLITRLFKRHSYRTYTYSMYGYRKLITQSGFDVGKTNFYIAYPGYNLPQYIIPFDDIVALRYFIVALARGKGLKGKVVMFFAQSDFVVKIMRHFFFSYLIYAQK